MSRAHEERGCERDGTQEAADAQGSRHSSAAGRPPSNGTPDCSEPGALAQHRDGVLHRAKALGLGWPLPEELDDATLEGRLYPPHPGRSRVWPKPVWEEIHRELPRKGVTLRLLWQECRRDHPDGYQYSRFCERYRRWEQHLDVVLRQPYRAGEKLFVDWAGLTLSMVEQQTGQLHDVYIFVAVLGMSNMTYLEGALAQDLPHWIGGHVRAFEYFSGAAAITAPDTTKTAVIRACRYEPELNRMYAEMAAHYGTVIISARPRRPRDRAKGESAVQVVERVVLAPLRDRTFFSLAEVNQALAESRERLNDLPFQKLPGSRRTLFETLDRPALQPLPAERYELAVADGAGEYRLPVRTAAQLLLRALPAGA